MLKKIVMITGIIFAVLTGLYMGFVHFFWHKSCTSFVVKNDLSQSISFHIRDKTVPFFYLSKKIPGMSQEKIWVRFYSVPQRVMVKSFDNKILYNEITDIIRPRETNNIIFTINRDAIEMIEVFVPIDHDDIHPFGSIAHFCE